MRVEFLPVIHGFLTALFGSARTAALMTLFGKWSWQFADIMVKNYKFNQIVIVSECTNYVDMWEYDYD